MAEQVVSSIKKGLEGVVAAKTSLSRVDGVKGELYYIGYSIHDLVKECSFEEIFYLLMEGKLPTRKELDELKETFRKESEIPEEVVGFIKNTPRGIHPMGWLRSTFSYLGFFDSEREAAELSAIKRIAQRCMGKMGSLIACMSRAREGKDYVSPKPELGIAGSFLYQLYGEEPTRTQTESLDKYLVLLADHGFNASTFGARVTVSTLSDYYSGITTAIGTLKGPLHGGANESAMKMLLSIKTKEKAKVYLREALDRKEKIMGFGHRVYKALDPRSVPLRKLSQELCKESGLEWLYELSVFVEETMQKEKGISCNVDFYSATVLYVLKIPIDFFTPIFALSRLAGWSAHIVEQRGDNRIIRPRAEYEGELGKKFIPMNDRA